MLMFEWLEYRYDGAWIVCFRERVGRKYLADLLHGLHLLQDLVLLDELLLVRFRFACQKLDYSRYPLFQLLMAKSGLCGPKNNDQPHSLSLA